MLLVADPGQKSELAAFVDQMDELTENAYQEQNGLSTANEPADGTPRHDVNHNLDAPEAPPLEFQDADLGVTIENTEDDTTVIKITAPDSGQTDFQDTMQAFDNIENDDESQHSNLDVEEITQTAEDNFVSTVRVGGDGEEVDGATLQDVHDIPPPYFGEHDADAGGGDREVEEITFDHTEVEHAAPRDSFAGRNGFGFPDDDGTEAVLFSEEGQDWHVETMQQQPQENVQGHLNDETPDTEKVSRPEDDEGPPSPYTVTVTKEYVISLKPGEFEYPPLPESAKKIQEPEEAPKIKSLRDAYRNSASEANENEQTDQEHTASIETEREILLNEREPSVDETPQTNHADGPLLEEEQQWQRVERVLGEDSEEDALQEESRGTHVEPGLEEPSYAEISHAEPVHAEPASTNSGYFLGSFSDHPVQEPKADLDSGGEMVPVVEEEIKPVIVKRKRNICLDTEPLQEPKTTRRKFRWWGPKHARSEPSVKDVDRALQLREEKSGKRSAQDDTFTVDRIQFDKGSTPEGTSRHKFLRWTRSDAAEDEHGTYFQKHGETSRSRQNIAQSREKTKKSLQSQYADLQVQFARWQSKLHESETFSGTKGMVAMEGSPQNKRPPLDRSASFAGSSAPISEESLPATPLPKSILKGASTKTSKPSQALPVEHKPPSPPTPAPSTVVKATTTSLKTVQPASAEVIVAPSTRTDPGLESITKKPASPATVATSKERPVSILKEPKPDVSVDQANAPEWLSARSRLKTSRKVDKLCIRYNADGSKTKVYKSATSDVVRPPGGSPQTGRRPLDHSQLRLHQQQTAPSAVQRAPPPPQAPSTDNAISSSSSAYARKGIIRTKAVRSEPTLDTRGELMLAIRGAGGRRALRPVSGSYRS